MDWYNYAREVCDFILQINENNVIGGPGIVDEIDESKVGKRKYHKGKRVDGAWVFGGIERDSKKCFFSQPLKTELPIPLSISQSNTLNPDKLVIVGKPTIL